MLLRLTAQNRVRLAYKHTWRLPIAPSQNAHEFALRSSCGTWCCPTRSHTYPVCLERCHIRPKLHSHVVAVCPPDPQSRVPLILPPCHRLRAIRPILGTLCITMESIVLRYSPGALGASRASVVRAAVATRSVHLCLSSRTSAHARCACV